MINRTDFRIKLPYTGKRMTWAGFDKRCTFWLVGNFEKFSVRAPQCLGYSGMAEMRENPYKPDERSKYAGRILAVDT